MEIKCWSEAIDLFKSISKYETVIKIDRKNRKIYDKQINLFNFEMYLENVEKIERNMPFMYEHYTGIISIGKVQFMLIEKLQYNKICMLNEIENNIKKLEKQKEKLEIIKKENYDN